MSSSSQFTRLPTNVTPVNYTLELTPNISEFVFQGRVVIDVKVEILLFFIIIKKKRKNVTCLI
jgi:hypothetical protein